MHQRLGTPGKVHVYVYALSVSIPTHWRASYQGTSFQGMFGSRQANQPIAEHVVSLSLSPLNETSIRHPRCS